MPILPDSSSSDPISPMLNEVFFAPLREIIQGGKFTRECSAIDDYRFVALCVMRVLQSSKSGRDFIQVHGMSDLDRLSRSNYFSSLSSSRRLAMITKTLDAMREKFLPELRADDDLLESIPELKGWEIWSMDGHAMAHATHDARNANDSYTAVKGIYKSDLRTGWTGFVDLQRPTEHGVEHEITTLKRLDAKLLRCGAPKGKSTIINYDTAIIDFQFSYNIKQTKSIYTLTGYKTNFKPMTAIARPIDKEHPVNALILSDEDLYFNNTPGNWRRITASCPDSGEIYITLTNEMTLPPGALNQVRRLRWNIEKTYNLHEQKLDERKAWTANENGKRAQAIAICIAHNLLKIFAMKLKTDHDIQDTKVTRAWHQELEKRVIAAHLAGREFPKKLYQTLYRPTEISLQFIRWLRSALSRPTCYRQAIAKLRPLMEKYI